MGQRKIATLVGVVMGSDSDWEVMKHAAHELDAFDVAYEARVLSAHRMPDDMFEYGEDSLHSIVQMPKGIPVATFAIGEAGAANAGLFAVALLAGTDPAIARKLAAFRLKQTNAARAMRVPPPSG